MFSKSKLAVMTSAAVLSLAAFGAQAAATDDGVVHFTGEVVNTPCNVATTSLDQTVKFGKLPAATIAAGTAIAPVAFKLDLANCSVDSLTNKTVQVTFDGASIPGADTELQTTGGTGVAITVSPVGGSDVTFGTADAALPVVDGSNSLAYQAVVKKATGGTIVPGEFTAVTNFTLAYQ
ncbi:fimbrial protein [Buttiauxella ferragutiae]|uniref:fimbrial protein n=1 Tax=Buttiauxella ferragutiae TaxID=82989 RepID=UPI0035263EB5